MILNNILELKNELNNLLINTNYGIESFIRRLETLSSHTLNIRDGIQAPYWRNYLHATLISSYMIKNGYNLDNWNQYFSEINSINRILGVSFPQESDVLELFVVHSINNVFTFDGNPLNIKAYRANSNNNPEHLVDDSNERGCLIDVEHQFLLENLKVVMKLRGIGAKRIWGDNDVIVTFRHNTRIQQYCIISCKTSLRERVYQSIFWSMHSRLESIGKHVFLTTDKGNNGQSEIGIRDVTGSARKTRDVLESTMDRVYVLRNSDQVTRSQVIKDFEYLEVDLKRWAADIAGI